MKCTLLGFKSIDFTDNNGKRIDGVKLFVAYPDSGTEGQAAEGKFIDRSVFDSFGVSYKELSDAFGCAVDLEYGPRNKVVGLSVV